MSTKIHACTDALGNAVRLLATAGQAGDCPQTLPLLQDLQPGKVLADTAYDSDENRAYCAEHGIEAVIPSHPNQLKPAEMVAETYRDRNKIERFFWPPQAVPTPRHALRKNRRVSLSFLARGRRIRLVTLIVLTL